MVEEKKKGEKQLSDFNYLETLEGFSLKLLDTLSAEIDGIDKFLERDRNRFMLIRIPIIILGISLPFVVAMQSAHPNLLFIALISSVIALLVAILTGLDSFFRYGENWASMFNAKNEALCLVRQAAIRLVKIQKFSDAEKIEEYEELIDELESGQEIIAKKHVQHVLEHIKEVSAAKLPVIK